MNPKIYNLAVGAGTLLIAGGVACYSLPCAAIVAGGLMIGQSMFMLAMARRG